MLKPQLTITDGPAKPDLLWAVAYPERHLHIHFETNIDPVDVHLDHLEELADGTSFGLTGHIVSSNYKNKRFKAVYHLSDRSGVIEIIDPLSA